MSHTLTITGMSCEHCVRRVTRALDSVPGLTVKQVDLGRALVGDADAQTLAAAVDALKQAGYEAEVSR